MGGTSETSEMGDYAPCLVHPRDRGLNGCRKQDFTKAKCSQNLGMEQDHKTFNP